MSNPSKRRGSAFEKAVCDYFVERGHKQVERRVMGGINDRGDIAGVTDWTLELKATKLIDLSGAMREAKTEAQNAGTSKYAAIIKKRSAPIKDAYVVLTLEQFVDLYEAIHGRPGGE